MDKIEDLHGHIFKVKDYNILPKETKTIFNESENKSLQSNRLINGFSSFILVSYEGKWAALEYCTDYLIVWLLNLIEYKPKNDIRWKKEK